MALNAREIHSNQEGDFMENEERGISERLEAATAVLERTLSWLEQRQSLLTGEVERISATVEQTRRETDLAERRTWPRDWPPPRGSWPS